MPPPVIPVSLVTLASAGDPAHVGGPVCGSSMEFSSLARWHDPNVRAAQYCAADNDVLWQRADHAARVGGVRSRIFAHNRGPALLELTQDAQHPYDVRNHSSPQIPPNYVQVASTDRVRRICRQIGEQSFHAGADALVVPTAQASCAGTDEYVLDVATCPTVVTARTAAKNWL
jgi:hypothetical protein